MKNKILMILMVSMLAMLIVLPMMNAAVTLTSPTAGSNNTGTITFTCTKAVGDNPLNATNASLYYALATSGGYSKLALSQAENSTVDDTSFSTASVSIAALADGVYNFTCYLLNATNENVNSSVVKVRVDQTDPATASITASATQISEKRPIVLTWSSTDAGSGIYTDSVSLVSPDASRCPTQTFTTGGTESLIDQDTLCAGYYTATLTATDYAGHTTTDDVTFRVTAPDGKFIGDKSIAPISDKDKNKNVVIVAVIIIIALIFFNRKK